MSEVNYILDPNTNQEFRILVNDLNIFCKDLPLDLYVSYVYDTSRNENEYYVLIADFESYGDKVKFYIKFLYYPETNIYRLFFYGYYEGYYEDLKNYESMLEKSYSPTNTDTEIKSVNDIYEEIIAHIKKGILSYEMDKENK